MKIEHLAPTLIAFIIFTAIAIIARIVPHIPNSAPITATALFAGCRARPRLLAIPFTLFVLLVSDYALLYVNPFRIDGTTGPDFSTLHSPTDLWYGYSQLAVYASFAISAVLGWLLIRRWTNWRSLGLITLTASVQFFLITNAAVVWAGNFYPHTLHGVWTSYVAGWPFFKGTLVGDFMWTGVFFGSLAYVMLRSWNVNATRYQLSQLNS